MSTVEKISLSRKPFLEHTFQQVLIKSMGKREVSLATVGSKRKRNWVFSKDHRGNYAATKSFHLREVELLHALGGL